MNSNRHAKAEAVPDHAPKKTLEERLGEVLTQVQVDARKAPQRYARDTEVPEGGE
jgi:hypothetical protein